MGDNFIEKIIEFRSFIIKEILFFYFGNHDFEIDIDFFPQIFFIFRNERKRAEFILRIFRFPEFFRPLRNRIQNTKLLTLSLLSQTRTIITILFIKYPINILNLRVLILSQIITHITNRLKSRNSLRILLRLLQRSRLLSRLTINLRRNLTTTKIYPI